jgi:formiminotetrahydrofolate cyclodeaminase
MDDDSLGGFLDALASSEPAPGGGAAAALSAALGAALVSMVCNLTIGKPRYAAHEQTMRLALAGAEEARATALLLVSEDAEAFSAVGAAYKLPKETDEEKAKRSEAVQEALRVAADVPLRTAAVAAEVVGLAEDILEGANVNVLSDVGVAAASARAALDSAAINVRVNLGLMTDTALRAAFTEKLDAHLAIRPKADRIVDQVAERVGG